MDMFVSKQSRNICSLRISLSRSQFEVTRTNCTQVSFSILEILPKNCVAHLNLNLPRSHTNARDFLFTCRQIIYCVTTAFAGKLLVTQFCKVCNYVFRSNFFSEKCFSFELLLDAVVVISKRCIEVQLFSRV